MWGRDLRPDTVSAFLARVDADWLVTGHVPCDNGFERPSPRHLILDSLGQPAASPAGDITVTVDDIIVAVGDDEPSIPVHASWHRLGVEAPPYALTGELPTLPGYDPGRALARPTGEFVVLRDVVLAADGVGEPVVAGVALLNRYAVERVEADLMLGFYFPGAALTEAGLAGA